MEKLRNYIEWQVFGVCTRIGEIMGISTFTIRKYFIYISCLTLGSPVVFYFILAFWMNLKRYILQGTYREEFGTNERNRKVGFAYRDWETDRKSVV